MTHQMERGYIDFFKVDSSPNNQDSVRNKAFPVVRDNQNLGRTINSYHEVVRSF